jgi:lipoprotein signal peptidase
MVLERIGTNRMKKLTALMSGLVALATASSASAGSTITSGYGGVIGTAVGNVMHKPNSHSQIVGTVAYNKGTLPFTGLNLATFVVIALLLIAIGFAVTRMSRRGDNA